MMIFDQFTTLRSMLVSMSNIMHVSPRGFLSRQRQDKIFKLRLTLSATNAQLINTWTLWI